MAGFGIPRRLPVEDIPEIVLSDSSDKSDGDLPVPSESSNDKKPIQSESSQVKNSGVKHSHPVHGPLSFPPAQVKSEEQALPEVKAKNVDSPVTELVTRPPIAVPPSTATPQPAATIPVTTMSATAPVTRIVSAIGSDVRTRPDQDPRLQRHRDPLASSTCAVVRTTNSYTSPVTLLVPPANISCSVSGKPLLQASGFRAPGGTSRLPSAVIPSSQTRLPSANFSRETSLLPTPSAAGVAISGTNLPMLSGPARLASFKNTMASFQGMKTAVATTVKTKAVSRPAPREFVIGPQSQILPVMPASPKLQGTLSSPLSHVTQSAVFTSSKATSHKHSAGTQVAKTGSSLPDGKPAAATKGKESRSQGSFQRLSLKTKNHVRPKMKIKVSSTVTSPSTLSGSPGANISPSQALADNGPAATSANTSPGQEIRVKPVSGATKVTKLQAVTSPVAGVLSKSKASPQHRENRLPAGSPKSTPDRRSAGRSRKGLLVFACAWKDCDYQFEDRDSLVKHLTAAQPGCHFADALEAKDTTCYWKGCTKNSDKSPKMSTLSLKMHLGQHEATAAIFISEEEVSRNFIPVNPNKGQTAEQESPFAAVYDEHVEAAVKEQAAKGKQQNNNKKKPVSARKESGRTGSAGKHDAKESTSQVPSTMLRKVQRDEKILLPEGWMDKDSNAGKVLIPTNGNDLQLPEPSVSTSSSSVSNVSASSKLSPARPILSTGSANVVQRSPAGQSNAATANKDGILTSESASEHKSDNIHTAIAGQVKAKSSGHDSLITNTTGLAGEGPGDVPDRTGQNRTHTSQDLAQLSPTAASTTASLAKVDPDIPSGPVNLLHSPEVSDSGTAADANMADEDLPEPMDVEHQHTRLMPATVVSIEHAYSNLELPPPEKPEKVEMVEVAKKGKEGQLPPTIKLVEICEDVRVPSASLVTTKLATKARCAYCHVEKYVSQMKRVEASTLVNTSWGHRGICFCRQRCRYNFISAYPQVEFLNLSFSDLLDGGIRENAPKLPRNISHMVQNTGNSSAVDKFTYKPAPEEAKGVSLLPTFNATTSSLAAGAKFSWATYLEETGALAAPDYCFPERHFPERNLFEGGMKVELACNLTQSPCDAYLATVTQVAGMRIQLTYDGADSSKPNSSVWRCIDALDIFPLGWCGSQGGQIVPPPGERTAAAQEWDDFLDKCLKHAIGAPDTYFPLKMTPTVPEFAPGHKVEISLDEDGAKRYCVATVAEVLADAVLVHLDGYEDDSSYYHTLPRDSTNLHPVGFCDERSLKLNPPKGVTDEVFDWSSYLTFTGSVAAPRELFRSTNNLFLQGMKLEAVDGRNPNMVCVAGIVDVIEDEIKIHFDGWADKFDFVVKKTDGNIFPVGWCAKFGHILTPPPALRGMNRPSETSSVSTPSQLAAAAAVGSFGGKRRRSSVPGLTPPSGKRKSISTAKGSPAPPRAIFNLSCNPGPYLDPQKVRVMTQEVAGSSVSIVLKSVLQFTIDAAYDQKAVFDMVRAGNSTVTVHCITQSGERLVKHLQVVDRNNILWSNLKNFFKNLQCCKRFLTQKHLAGQCERCTLHGGAGQYDAASVGGTPIEQQYTDGSWLGGNGQGKQEVEYLSPMSQSFNPSRPVVLNTNGGSAVLNAHANMRPDAGLFNDPKIEHLASKHPKSWSVDEVRLFFECTETEEHVATLVEQEIDGNAMCLLTPDSLVRYMGLRLGPSLKICGRVDGLKSKWNIH